MNKKWHIPYRLSLLTALLFCSLINNSFAQSKLRLQHITVDEGLSQSSVNYVTQDAYGFMWFATGDGLNRYDGKEIVPFKSSFNDTSSAYLHDRNINSRLIEDDEGKIWMSTDAGISFLSYKQKLFNVTVDRRITGSSVMLSLDNGLIYTAVPRRGIVTVDIHSRKYNCYFFADKWQNDTQYVVPCFNSVVTSKGLLIADARGLLLFDTLTRKDTRVLSMEGIYMVNRLQDGRILLNGADGIYFYDTASLQTEFIPLKQDNQNGHIVWHTFAQDLTSGYVYLGSQTDGTICKFDPVSRKYEFIHFETSIINSLFIDHSRNLWVGTEGDGVYKLDLKPPKFYNYTPSLAAASNSDGFMVKSIYRDEKGRIWMGVLNKGIWIYDPAQGTQKNVQLPLSVDGLQVTSLLKDSSGHMVATAGNTIFWLDAETGKTLRSVALPAIAGSSPDKPVIYSIAEWKKNHYLIATNLCLYLVKTEHDISTAVVTKFFTRNSFGTWTYGLANQNDGYIYIGRRSGFSKVQVINDTSIRLIFEGFDNFVVRHFYKSTHTPILWLATEQGLIAYNETTKRFKLFDEFSGLGNSNIYAILPQNDSSLWISTNKGISNAQIHYAGGNPALTQATFTNYTAKDGLQSNEFNTGAYFLCSDNTMIFGGINGINWFQPGNIRTNPFKPQPAITALYVNDTLFAGDTANFIQALTLPYRSNTISITIRALEYTQPEQNMFAYKLEGLDNDWVYTTGDKVRYSNLPPGQYTFLVKARNNENTWNEEPHHLQITITPPYWQEWWFRIMVALCIGAIALLAARYYIMQKVKARTLELEKLQALNMERLRISKDVHDDLGSGLSKIALMADLAQKQVIDNIRLGKDIQHISSVSKDLIDNMRDLIWVLNPENTTLDNLVAHLREYCSDYLEGTQINALLDFPDHVPDLRISREIQRNIFSTVKEAINNCVKHSGATEIKITLTLTGALHITIYDNGQGIDLSRRKGTGNGMRNMRQRIEAINGDFNISSSATCGTTIEISIPIAKLNKQ